MKILIAEDTEDSRILLQVILESEGYEVISTENGKEALELIRKETPDMIITDILMPEMDGFELCKQLKKDDRFCSVPVVFYTATYTTQKDKEYAQSLGVSRFIIKPMEPDLFIKEIKEVIEEAKLHTLAIPTELLESEEKLTDRYSKVLYDKLEHKIKTLQNEIKEHKCARQELLHSQEQLRQAMDEIKETKIFLNNIIEFMPSILIVLDNNYTIIQWNRAAENYFTLKKENVVNNNLFSLVPELFSLKKDCESIIKSHMPHTIHNTSFNCINNKFFNVSLFHLLTDRDHESYIVIRFDDITEVKKVEEQLVQSQKMELLGQLAGGIAHDFNNQLSGLLAYTEIIQSKFSNNPEMMSYAEKMIVGIQRSSELIQKLLAFSRKGKYVCKPFDLHSIIEEVISILQHSINKQITIHRSCNAHNYIIEGDATEVQNALLNLAINARDAMPDGGDLTFSTDNVLITENNYNSHTGLEKGEYILVTVHDTGIGIDSTIMKHIFEPFFTTKEMYSGSGMGLAAVHGTINNHKGIIKVESEPEQGTSFHLYLPVSQKSIIDTANKKLPITGSATILLIEDELLIRESEQEILRNLGYTVISCENGDAGVREYENNWQKIDVVILDIIMPGLNGYETFKRMKIIHSPIKVLFTSGYGQTSEIQELCRQDNIYFIGKPFKVADLTQKITEILNKD